MSVTIADDIRALLAQISIDAEALIAAASTIDELEEAQRTALGKKSKFKSTSDMIKQLEPSDRPAIGKEITDVRSRLTELVESRRPELQEQEDAANALDLTLPPRGLARGHLHLITQIERELEDIFVGLGYSIGEGPEVESDWFNFEALNFPPGHPARDMQDTLYVNRGGEKEVVLRTQTSNVQVRTMKAQEPPVYVVSPGRVYRQETSDARHSPVFHQLECLAVDEGITMGDMFGTIGAFLSAIFGETVQTRFQPSFFPFTEPSGEFAASCVFCEGSGCRICSKTGWIELGGCGMVDPNVFDAVGYDSEKYTGFAFGFGIERIAMIRHGVDNIGSFFSNDVRFLKQF